MNKRRKSLKTKEQFPEEIKPLNLSPTDRCFTFPAPISSVIQFAKATVEHGKGEQQVRAYFGDKLPDNYKHKPGTVILVDPSGYPILHLNEDGTVSGLDAKVFYQGDGDAPTSSPFTIPIIDPQA